MNKMKNKKIGQPPLASREQHLLQEALEGSGEIPLIVIVSVSVCGTVLFLLNIVLISCFVHKKRQKEKEQQKQTKGPGSSEGKVFHGGKKWPLRA
jgi:ABC-type taurine transport system ATPase subunit